jgi:GGDEF domain-containing protein
MKGNPSSHPHHRKGAARNQRWLEHKESERMIQRMAYYDILTDLPNRNLLHDRLLNAIRIDNGKQTDGIDVDGSGSF